MLYRSLENYKNFVSFEEATLKGLSPDGSLYVPKYIPILDFSFIKNIDKLDDEKISMSIIRPYIDKKSIPDTVLKKIIIETINFPFPLKNIHDNIYTLELFHGPTLAFKDVGANFMAKCLSFFSRKTRKKITVLVATSGDTGGAVAHGFYKKKGIDVIILYPHNGISKIQEKQITSLGCNIFPIEIYGNFDDCQNIVKKSFLDEDIRKKYILTSANSINIARLIPQMIYYFLAYKKIKKIFSLNSKLVFSIPSGNFGNICAGMMAEKMGLPIDYFIASTNINDTIPRFLKTKKYKPNSVKKTISNAMDISNPSNFPRIWSFLYKKDILELRKKLFSYSFTDKETIFSIEKIWKKYKYIMDPHGSVGYLGIVNHMKKNINNLYNNFIFLETAHPVKFIDNIPFYLKKEINISKNFLNKYKKKCKKNSFSNNFNLFKEWLLNK